MMSTQSLSLWLTLVIGVSTAFAETTKPLDLSTTSSVGFPQPLLELPPPAAFSSALSDPLTSAALSYSLPDPQLSSATLELISQLELPPVAVSPLSTTAPLVTEMGMQAPTSMTLSMDTVTALEEPLTNRSVFLNTLDEFEEYVQGRIERIETIDLNAVVVRAVCRNLNIHLRDIDHLIAGDEFVAQQGIFDLRISGISQVIRTQSPSGLPLGSFGGVGTGGGTGGDDDDGNNGGGNTGGGGGGAGDSKTVQNRVTVGQLLPTGGLVELIVDNTKTVNTSSNQPGHVSTTRAGLQATQPLLKNGGPLVTQSRIVLADFDSKITASQFRQQVMQEVATAIQQYYDLIFAVSNVEVLRVALAQSEELLRVNRAKFEAGVLPELDVLQAEADVVTRQQDVIVALQQVEGASDALKTQLAAIEDPTYVSLRPKDQPKVPDYELVESRFVDEALAYRPEIEQSGLELDKQGINVRVAHNQTLPQVDLFGNYTPTGSGNDRGDSFAELSETRTADWRFGVQFNYPLQNREARFRFHQAEKRVDQALIRIQQMRNNVILDVRNSIRALETNRASIGVARASVEVNRLKVNTARQRQDVGLATSFDVLFFQRDLANARINLLRSVIEYNKAIVGLERSKGTLLESLGILVCDSMIMHSSNKPKKALGISE